MSGIVHIVGDAEGALAVLAARLGAASFEIEQGAAAVLVTLAQTAEDAIESATAFAKPARQEDRLVVHIWQEPDARDWPRVQHAANLSAFTRYSALVWAGWRVRVNAIVLVNMHADDLGNALQPDVRAAILALSRWRSMTGQIIRLNA